MAEFACGSDFTARTPEFREYMDNVLLALAAADGEWEDIDAIPCVHSDATIGEYTAQARALFRETVGVTHRERWIAHA